MSRDLDLDLGPGGLDLGDWDVGLGTCRNRKMRWVFLATARFLFPRLAGLAVGGTWDNVP